MSQRMSDPLDAGAARFSGFADLYDAVRPVPPADLAKILCTYVGRDVATAVDLGSGTGSSSRWAAGWADEVVGIEPSDDMRMIAAASGGSNITYLPGWSHQTGLPDGCADVVLAVQALHWMEPGPTHSEVARLLRPGGLFAAIDCDWPPIVGDVELERQWDLCRRTIRVFETRMASGESRETMLRSPSAEDVAALNYTGADAHQDVRLAGALRGWSKSEHLTRMESSGRYRWCQELALASREYGDANRFVGLMRSQGDYQLLHREGIPDEVLGLDRLAEVAHRRLAGVTEWSFVYRVRLGFA